MNCSSSDGILNACMRGGLCIDLGGVPKAQVQGDGLPKEDPGPK